MPNVSAGGGGFIRVEGAKELRRAMTLAAADELKKELKDANKAAAEMVADEARFSVPTRSGRLAASIRASGGTASGKVRAGRKSVPYAGVIHFGWPQRNIAAQPFLYEAADARVNEVLEAYEASIKALEAKLAASTKLATKGR